MVSVAIRYAYRNKTRNITKVINMNSSKSKAFQTIVSIINTSAANGLTLSQALPEILDVKVGRTHGHVYFRNSMTGNETSAYSNAAHALQVALKNKQKWNSTAYEDDEPTLAELLVEPEAFSVNVALKNGKYYYDMYCDGSNTSLEGLFDIDSWMCNISEYIYVLRKGEWKTGAEIEYEAKNNY